MDLQTLPYFKGAHRQRGRGFGALAQTFGRLAVPFVQKYLVPAAKRVGADLVEFAAPEVAGLVAGKTSIKNVAKQVATKTARKQLGGGRKKVTKRKRSVSRKTRSKSSRSRKDFFANLK